MNLIHAVIKEYSEPLAAISQYENIDNIKTELIPYMLGKQVIKDEQTLIDCYLIVDKWMIDINNIKVDGELVLSWEMIEFIKDHKKLYDYLKVFIPPSYSPTSKYQKKNKLPITINDFRSPSMMQFMNPDEFIEHINIQTYIDIPISDCGTQYLIDLLPEGKTYYSWDYIVDNRKVIYDYINKNFDLKSKTYDNLTFRNWLDKHNLSTKNILDPFVLKELYDAIIKGLDSMVRSISRTQIKHVFNLDYYIKLYKKQTPNFINGFDDDILYKLIEYPIERYLDNDKESLYIPNDYNINKILYDTCKNLYENIPFKGMSDNINESLGRGRSYSRTLHYYGKIFSANIYWDTKPYMTISNYKYNRYFYNDYMELSDRIMFC